MEYALGRIKEGRFRSVSAYLQHLVNRERTGADSPMAHLEEKLSQTLLAVRDEVAAVHLSAEGNNAFLHALAKYLLVNLHEMAGEEKEALQRTAPSRYERLLKVAGTELALRMDEGGVDAPR